MESRKREVGNQAPANTADKIEDRRLKLVEACRRDLSESQRHEILSWIADEVLRKSKCIKKANFDLVGLEDLERMASLYDHHFFDGHCLGMAKDAGLSFRWSRRMTSAGGKTTRTSWPATLFRAGRTHYEITLSSSLLFQTFREDSREARVCGCICNNRLEAMQRILEHEMIHLLEMLVWIDSNCAAPRFQSITSRLFGHKEHRHELVTQRERASKHSTFGWEVAWSFDMKARPTEAL